MDGLFNREKVEKILNTYPQLEVVLLGGMVSKKMCRELLDIDRWLMDDIYKELILSGAVKGVSSSMFRAKDDTVRLIQERMGRLTSSCPENKI